MNEQKENKFGGKRSDSIYKAVRAKCLDCSGTSPAVQSCDNEDCSLWPFRLGKRVKSLQWSEEALANKRASVAKANAARLAKITPEVIAEREAKKEQREKARQAVIRQRELEREKARQAKIERRAEEISDRIKKAKRAGDHALAEKIRADEDARLAKQAANKVDE